MSARITIVTAGHLATCPRMLKAVDALDAAGYAVRVVSTRQTPWATAADEALRRSRTWLWDVVDCSRESAPARWLATGARFRAAQAVTGIIGSRAPHVVAVSAFSRVHDELVGAVLREPADLIYGGTAGALAAVAEAGRRSGTPFAVDFEDFHCAEHDASSEAGRLANDLAATVMADVLRDARFATAGSHAIAAACVERFQAPVIPISNVFPLPRREPSRPSAPPGPMRLYWFSQTIGPGRGLEDVVRAAGLLGRPCELHLRGVDRNGYVDTLRALASHLAPALVLHVHPPGSPDDMVDACRDYSAGIASEPGRNGNNALSLSNKALTYPLAGIPVILTMTPGQSRLAADLGEGAVSFEPGDAVRLADGLERWHAAGALARAGEAAWEAARRRWHWEHPAERGTLLQCVEQVLA